MIIHDSIAIVLRKFMVKVVVSFTIADDCSKPMITGSVMIIICIVTHIMCKTIHTKGGVVSKHKSKHTSIVETTLSYAKDM